MVDSAMYCISPDKTLNGDRSRSRDTGGPDTHRLSAGPGYGWAKEADPSVRQFDLMMRFPAEYY